MGGGEVQVDEQGVGEGEAATIPRGKDGEAENGRNE